MDKERASGILMHITSLPSRYGVGDLGPAAYDFADFLHEAGQKYWQVLPLNPTDESMGWSPYSGLSAFAGNTLLISPEMLAKDKFVEDADLESDMSFDKNTADYEKAETYRKKIFLKAYEYFIEEPLKEHTEEYEKFCSEHDFWLDDYSLFVALREKYGKKTWREWPTELRDRKPAALREVKDELKHQVGQEKFLQFVFFRQWHQLKAYCHGKNIRFIGDLPYYVGFESADVWSQPQYFKLSKSKKPLKVGGVPPDYFSETGQLWGMPCFNWNVLKKDKYSWWVKRLIHNIKWVDLLRLDHFRAFSAYWEITAGEETAINGKWVKCPGEALFDTVRKKLGKMPFIAEDLGEIDQPVYDLIDRFRLPNMKVLQFAFGDDLPGSIFAPHNFNTNCIVYTGTHDNSTTIGWWKQQDKKTRKQIQKYAGTKSSKRTAGWDMMMLALRSVARIAMFPMQDVLKLDDKAIMNRPSTAEGNWRWRMLPNQWGKTSARKLRSRTKITGRI